MHSACESLRLDEIVVVHAGSDSYPLSPKIRAVALERLHLDVEPFSDDCPLTIPSRQSCLLSSC